MRPGLLRSSLGALVALAFVMATTAACRVEPSSLSVTTVVGGLDRPWDLAFTPGGNIVFTERVGRINIRFNGQRRVLATPTDVVVAGEGGMLGIAVDPQFAANRRIYTCMVSNRSGAADVRVVRWRINEAVTALTDRTDILTGIPASGASHMGCRIRFGPDGYLWIGTGDATQGPAPQSRTSLGGKVLRITTDGAGAPGNAGGGFRAEVYTYGHRNVQGIAFSPGGQAYAVEHGTDRDDEVNRLVRGGNYGWDPVAPGTTGDYDQTRPMTDLTKFPTAQRPVWSSGSPTIAPSGATFLTGERWAGWNGALAMAVLKGQQLRVLALNADGTAIEQQWTRVTDRGRLRVAVQGPDGSIYLATDANPGAILRVDPPATAG
jgi:glucose/arabinose dehydrogenase